MVMQDVSYKITKSKPLEAFEIWRLRKIEEVVEKCLNHKKYNGPNGKISEEARLGFKLFPKTMVRLTRQMCQCEEDCTRNSLLDTTFSKECRYFDVDNLMGDDKYYKSKFVGKKVLLGELTDEKSQIEEGVINFNIEDAINELCDDKEDSFKNLKCKVYEAHDYCLDRNDKCLPRIMEIYLPDSNCKNPDFKSQIESIIQKFELPEIKYYGRHTRDIKSICGESLNKNLGLKNRVSNSILSISLILMLLYFVREMGYKSRILFSVAAFLCLGLSFTSFY